MKKVCKNCKEEKDLSEFSKHKSNKDRLAHNCKKCTNEYYRNLYEKRGSKKQLREYPCGSFEQLKNYDLKLNHNITLKDYYKILEDQDFKCKICGIHKDNLKQSLSVDHDHITGRIRGLLCPNCNHGLGKFHDNILLLENAINYLNFKE